MPPFEIWPVPFFLDPNNLAVDAVVTFVVAILLAITINAEAQAYVAYFLGDDRPGAKDRLHFIAFFHLDVLGTVSYLVGGFGWPRTIDIDPEKLKHPRLYLVLIRLAGPLANLLLGSIVGSIVFVMKVVEYDPRVFAMLVGVNVTTAIYNLLPLPPLFGGSVIAALIPQRFKKIKWTFWLAGPFAILAIILLERITRQGIISPYFNPIITKIFQYIMG
jgi:Zn-dependent protease